MAPGPKWFTTDLKHSVLGSYARCPNYAHSFTVVVLQTSSSYLITVNSEGTEVVQPLTDGALPTCNASSEANDKWAGRWVIFHTLGLIYTILTYYGVLATLMCRYSPSCLLLKSVELSLSSPSSLIRSMTSTASVLRPYNT